MLSNVKQTWTINIMASTTINATTDIPASVAFLQKMMTLLNDETAPEALWWMPGSVAFGLEPDLLSTQVLDKCFQGSKFTSFLRRLHKAGFRRKTREFKQLEDGQGLSKTAIVFQHDWFQKGKPELLHHFGEKPKAASHFKAAAKTAQRSASPVAVHTGSPVESPRAVANHNLTQHFGLGRSYLMQQFAQTAAANHEASPLSSGSSSPVARRASGSLPSGSLPSAATRLLALRLMQQQSEEQQLLRQRQEGLMRERMIMAGLLRGNNSPVLGSSANNCNRPTLLERLAALQQHHHQL